MEKLNKTLLIGLNLGDHGSTGGIMRNSLEYASENGNFDYLVIAPHKEGHPNCFGYLDENPFLDRVDRHFIHRSKGLPDGFFDYRVTKRIIRKIKKVSKQYSKTIVHLHNIHMAHISFPVLFKYLSKSKIKVIYTLHDCWSFTGGCYHYNFVGCNEWQNGCKCKCCQNYDTKRISVEKNYNFKKKYTSLFNENQLTIVTVSNWLKEEATKSFLSKYKIIVNYGETNFVSRKEPDNELKEKLALTNKKIVLAVSAYWNDWKGQKYLFEVGKLLPENYVLLVIGGSLNCSEFKNIIHFRSVKQDELASFYSIADVYLSVSQSETLGLTTCEAQMSGVPVVCFGHTAIKETITEKSGIIVGEDNNVGKMVESIIYAVENKPFKKEDIIESGNRFKKYSSARRYFEIYNK